VACEPCAEATRGMRETCEIKGVIFDMDGTLTVSELDFGRIRREAGVPEGVPILEYLGSAPPHLRRRVEGVLERHESQAARRCGLRRGARHVLETLRARGIRVALLTRNSRSSVEILLERFCLHFDCCVSREDAAPKPSAEPVLKIAAELGLEASELLVVGDYVFDVEAGRAAGARTAFLKTEHCQAPLPEADFVLSELAGVLDLLPGTVA